MKYHVIRQYKNGEKILCAEFLNVNDANLFIEKMSFREKSNATTYHLINQIANAHSSITDPFNVVIRKEDAEMIVAKFGNLNDAIIFIEQKLLEDKNLNEEITYYLLDGETLVDKYNQATLSAANEREKRPRHLIQPSLPTLRFRPKGSAYGIYNTDDEEDDKE